MKMKFKVDSQLTEISGTVTSNNTDRFSVHFIDDDKMEFKHTDVDKFFMATALEQTDFTVTLANDLLHLLSNRPLLESIWTAFTWKKRENSQALAKFTSEFQDDTTTLLNSEAGSARRNSIIDMIVKKFEEYHSMLQSYVSIDQAVLQWVTNVAKFDCLQQKSASVMPTHPAVGTSGVAVSAADSAAGSHTQLSDVTPGNGPGSMSTDQVDTSGYTALIRAAAVYGPGKEAIRLSQVETCMRSSNPRVASPDGLTALDWASHHGDATLVEALLLAFPGLALQARTYQTNISPDHFKPSRYSPQSLGLRTDICGASSLWIACHCLHVEVSRSLILAGGKELLAHTSERLGGFLHAACDTMSISSQGAEARRSEIVKLLLLTGGQTLAQVKNSGGETAYELVTRILGENKRIISRESGDEVMTLLKQVQNVGSPADESVLSQKFHILDEDWDLLAAHVPMVCSVPAKFASIPIDEGGDSGESTVLKLGYLHQLVESRSFDPARVCLIKLASPISDQTSAVGKEIDEALHLKAVFCNSSASTTMKNCIPALFEDVSLIARDQVFTIKNNCEVHRGKIDCEHPTPAYNAVISYCQHGRGTINSEDLDALKPGVYDNFVKIATTIQKHVLAAMQDWSQRNQKPLLFPSEMEMRSLALLLTFPRNLGAPTKWHCDSTGGCQVRESKSAFHAKNADLQTALPAADSEVVVTRSSMLPSPFPSSLFFLHHSLFFLHLLLSLFTVTICRILL